ncbi:MAG: ATP-binding protein [Cypionkella sp.]
MAQMAAAAETDHSRLMNAIRALSDSVMIFDADDRLVAVNEAYSKVVPQLAPYAVPGVTLSELLWVGLEIGVFLGGDTQAEKDAWVQDRLAEYHKPQSEDEVLLGDGRWLHRINTRTSDGGLILMGIDISTRRNQIAALEDVNKDLGRVLADRDRAEMLRNSIIEAAAVGTWQLDMENGVIRAGGRWGEILGLETRNFARLCVADFLAMVHPDDQSKLNRPVDFGPGPDSKIISAEFRMRHRDGRYVWILSRSRVTERAADGTPVQVVGVHLDISDRKQLEQEVAASRAFLLEVMDASASAIVVLDGTGKITFATREAEHVLGMRQKFATGQAFDISALMLEQVDGGPLPEHGSPVSMVQHAQGPVRDVQYALLRLDGARRILSCNAAPLASDAEMGADTGTVRSGIVMSFTDITDKLAATARLEEALTRAEDMSRAKSTFLANMSHEIRTPLNGVLGMAEVLAGIVVEPVERQMVDTIRKSGETLLTVLNGILDMSKIEAGKMEIESVSFLPLDLIHQVEAIYAIAAEEKGVEFEVLASAGCDRPRLGDPHRLMQVLNNLLNNAIKFTEVGKVVLKLSCRPGKPVVIEVSDSGIGMDQAQASRIFESFEQADGSMTRRFGGTGLGLSIVRQLVTLMGGEISAQSTPGLGSRFRVTLPLPETETSLPVRVAVSEVPSQKDTLAGVRILSADDNATNRLVLSEMLAKSGALVTQVENGRDAIAAWMAAQDRGEPFAMLLLDITMPVLDGMSALAKIRAAEAARSLPSVPAIAITAHAMPRQIADYIVGGFDTHLAKPFRQRDLLHAAISLLRL